VKTIAALFLMCLMIISPARAQDQSDRQKQLQAAWEAAIKASV
jgi:hypothetical protein